MKKLYFKRRQIVEKILCFLSRSLIQVNKRYEKEIEEHFKGKKSSLPTRKWKKWKKNGKAKQTINEKGKRIML